MSTAEKLINDLDVSKLMLCNSQTLTPELRIRIGQAINSAIDLLKEQEPRVLTLEEVMKHYSLPPVFVDDLNMQDDYLQDIQPLYFEFLPERPWHAHWLNYDQVENIRESIKARYGTIIRAWSAKPTDEQRKAVKWDCNEPPKEEAHE